MEKDEWVVTKSGKFRFIILQIYSFSSFSSSFFSFSVYTSVFFAFMVPCIDDNIYLIIVQRDSTQSSLFIILQVHSTCFGCQPHPSSGVHKTVTTTSGTGHIICAATSLQRGQGWPRWREVAAQYRRL